MPTIYHIPICPFCQRLEILCELKGVSDEVKFEVVDITVPRSEHILKLTGGSTALPVMEIEGGRALKESLVLMDYLETRYPNPVRREDPYERAIENLLATQEGSFTMNGYIFVMNQDPEKREVLKKKYLDSHLAIDAFLRRHSTGDGPFLFDEFGWAEAIFTPMFQRFWFVDYYEGVDIPETRDFDRVREWRDACIAHPAAQQTSYEEIVKLYYDYARNAGNGALLEGRTKSSFAFEPHWSERPMPPKDKFSAAATDAQLGLV